MRRLIVPAFAALAALASSASALHAQLSVTLPPQSVPLADLRAFRAPSANWRVAGAASADRARALTLQSEPGTGVLVNLPTTGANGHLLTSWEHGDIDLSLDVMLPKGSNSGVYLMGRYEVQLLDSWGVRTPTFADLGAIYQRWDEKRGAGREGFEPHPPRVNASRAPGLWQRVDIQFRAPRFEGKKKVANARFLKVMVNGVVVQENVEVTGPTRAAAFADERPTGPLMIQGDHGPVALRNIQYKTYSGAAALSGLRYRAYVGDAMDSAWIATHQPVREGAVSTLSSEPAQAPNRFALAYDGSLSVPATGRYRFTLNLNWIGTEAAMRGVKVGAATLRIDGKPVLLHLGDVPQMVADAELTAGKHAFALSFHKNREWGAHRDVSLFIEGPGVERQALHDESALSTFGNPVNPIMLTAETEPVLLRSFVRHRDTKRVIVMSVADPLGVHYSYDLAQGSLLYAWRGPFIETTQMWDGRGEDQLAQPAGSPVELPGTPALAFLGDANAAWPDSITDERQFKRGGFRLDKAGHPVYLAQVRGIAVEDAIRPDSAGIVLRRELSLRAPASVSTDGLHVQLAQGKSIVRQSDGSYAVDDQRYYVTVAGGAQPMVRQQNGRHELLLPVRFERGEAKVAYDIVW